MLRIFEAKTEKELAVVRELFEEYAYFLKTDIYQKIDSRFREQHWQELEEDTKYLPGDYGAPKGCILLAEYQGQAAGCVAIKELDVEICKMKRLYVRPQFRNLGIGKGLSKAIIEHGEKLGYHCMRLHTSQLLDAAMELYKALGFKEIAPYQQSLTETSVFLELKL